MASKFAGKNNTAGVSAYVDSRGEQAVLGKLSRLMTKSEDVVVQALDAGADTVYRSAVQRVPKRTGTLCRSIHKEVMAAGGSLSKGANYQSVTSGGRTVVVGTDCSYALYVEKGTCKMRAQPYLQPAFDANKSKIANNVKRSLESAIREQARK